MTVLQRPFPSMALWTHLLTGDQQHAVLFAMLHLSGDVVQHQQLTPAVMQQLHLVPYLCNTATPPQKKATQEKDYSWPSVNPDYPSLAIHFFKPISHYLIICFCLSLSTSLSLSLSLLPALLLFRASQNFLFARSGIEGPFKVTQVCWVDSISSIAWFLWTERKRPQKWRVDTERLLCWDWVWKWNLHYVLEWSGLCQCRLPTETTIVFWILNETLALNISM